MSIQPITEFPMDLTVGKDNPDLRGYFKPTKNGGLANSEIRSPYEPYIVYIVESLYVNSGDQVIMDFPELPTYTSIDLTFSFPDECQADETVNLTNNGTQFDGTSTTLFALLDKYGSAEVLCKVNQ